MKHTTRRTVITASVFTSLGSALMFSCPSASAQSLFCDFAAADARAQQILIDTPVLNGIGVLVADRSGVVHEAYFGDYDAGTIVSLASASKLISAAAIMTLADGGPLNLTAPVRQYLPEFSVANAGLTKSLLTADQMYSMTSGFTGDGSQPVLGDRTITNDQAVAEIACCIDPDATPGTDLRYTGLGMHVVGRVAEVLSGQQFDDFFETALAEPLGITTMSWDGLGPTQNFRPSGGGASSLPDYARVLRMLLRRGELDGVRVLSEGAVQSMFVERTVGLPQASVPASVPSSFGYAFGMWVEERSAAGFPAVLSSPGAFGFTPVIDLEDNYVVAVMVRGNGSQLAPAIREVRSAIDQAMTLGCRSCAADTDRNGTTNVDDIIGFVNAYAASLPSADVTPDAVYNVNDVITFVNSFNNGCP